MTNETAFPFEQLEIYGLALDLASAIYRLSAGFPADERFGLTNQIRRASVSISLNIAEGRGRRSDREFVRFLLIARGSLFEVMSGVQIAQRLEFLSEQHLTELREQIRVLNAKLLGLIKHLETRSA